MAGEAVRCKGSSAVMENDSIAQLGNFFGKVGSQTLGGASDKGDWDGGALHERMPKVRATARTLGISWVRRRSVFPRIARTAKRDSAERTSSSKNSNAWGRA